VDEASTEREAVLQAAADPQSGELARGLPAAALRPAPVPGAPCRVLVFPRLPAAWGRAFDQSGVELTSEPGLARAVGLIAEGDYHAVLVDPLAADAMALVKALKWRAPCAAVSAGQVARASDRLVTAPVILLPLPGENDYAVLLAPPTLAWLEDASRLALAEVVRRFDGKALLAAVVG
jgi:hypothetical protein